jgi:hypothetical protein
MKMKNVFTHIKKFAHSIFSIYDYNKSNEDHIRKFVETEYRPKDRGWAYDQLKNKI